jgi:hypothetical protein
VGQYADPVAPAWPGHLTLEGNQHDWQVTDSDFDRALSVGVTQTGEANSEAADDGKALQGMEAAELPAQENCPQPEALQQVAGIYGILPSSGKTLLVGDTGLEPVTSSLSSWRSSQLS